MRRNALPEHALSMRLPCVAAVQSLLAHAAGFAALDARGDLVAATGYVNRMGRLVLDTYAKVRCSWGRARRGVLWDSCSCSKGSEGTLAWPGPRPDAGLETDRAGCNPPGAGV